jgi:glycosyltransferase involved in cell wall biosynthesis
VTKPRIIFTLFDFYIGGIESFLYNLAKKLNQKYEFFFLATHVPKFQDKFFSVGRPVFIPYQAPDEIIRLFKDINPDIVQIHNDVLPLNCALRAGVKNLIERTDGPRSCTRLPKDNFKYVIASTQGTIPLIEKCISRDKIKLIYNGVDLVYIKKTTPKLLLTDQCFIIGRSSRFGRGQNIQLLINAVKILCKKYPHIRLVLIGGNSLMPGAEDVETDLRKLTIGYEKFIYFLGNIEEPQSVINSFDVVTCVSNDEGIPNSLMEGMAAGIPAVSTDVGQVNELVTHNYNGLLIQKDNLKELIDALELYILNPTIRKLHGQNAYKTIEDNFNIQNSAKEYDKLYKHILRF